MNSPLPSPSPGHQILLPRGSRCEVSVLCVDFPSRDFHMCDKHICLVFFFPPRMSLTYDLPSSDRLRTPWAGSVFLVFCPPESRLLVSVPTSVASCCRPGPMSLLQHHSSPGLLLVVQPGSGDRIATFVENFTLAEVHETLSEDPVSLAASRGVAWWVRAQVGVPALPPTSLVTLKEPLHSWAFPQLEKGCGERRGFSKLVPRGWGVPRGSALLTQ